MEKASKQNITTIIDDITISSTPTITTTSVITTNKNTAKAAVTDPTCKSSSPHQSGTVLNMYVYYY